MRINWRKLMYHVNVQLWTRMEVRSDHKERTTCLMVNDTNFPKTDKRMERIGRVHSHLEHRSILGFKALFLGITDGVSQMLLDFALVGEEGSKKNYGMSQKKLDARYAPERDKDDDVGERLAEYDKDKITLAMDMVRTAIKSGIRFQFLKNVLISDRNFVTLCIGIGVMSLFVSHLKVTHFLRHTQESNAFFAPIYSRFY